jgi:FKBP-type peptidyl-prolyl cis-trans isomerase FkpA
MRRLTILALVLGLFACFNTPAPAEEPALESDDQKMLYALGQAVARGISTLEFTDEEMVYIQMGLRDAATGKESRVDMAQFGPRLDSTMQARVTQLAQRENEAGKIYCDQQASVEGAEKLPSGLIFQALAAGDGPAPVPGDQVKVHYHGTLRDGTVFDSTRGKDPVQFAVTGVIPCFSEGLQKLNAGGKARLTCPSQIAYGDRGSPPKIKPGAALTFEVELVEVVGKPAAAAAPAESEPIP